MDGLKKKNTNGSGQTVDVLLLSVGFGNGSWSSVGSSQCGGLRRGHPSLTFKMAPLRVDLSASGLYGVKAVIFVCSSSFPFSACRLCIPSVMFSPLSLSPKLFTPYITFLFLSQSSSASCSVCLPQLCVQTAKADSFDLSAVHVVEI